MKRRHIFSPKLFVWEAGEAGEKWFSNGHWIISELEALGVKNMEGIVWLEPGVYEGAPVPWSGGFEKVRHDPGPVPADLLEEYSRARHAAVITNILITNEYFRCRVIITQASDRGYVLVNDGYMDILRGDLDLFAESVTTGPGPNESGMGVVVCGKRDDVFVCALMTVKDMDNVMAISVDGGTVSITETNAT